MTERKVYGATWFTTHKGTIGIVAFNNGYEDKAYIGVVAGEDPERDVAELLERGVPFPFEHAVKMTGVGGDII